MTRYTPFASPSPPGISSEGSLCSKNDDDSDSSGNCVPASSSTVLPSSPIVSTPPDGPSLNAECVIKSTAAHSIYALDAEDRRESEPSDEMDEWFVHRITGKTSSHIEEHPVHGPRNFRISCQGSDVSRSQISLSSRSDISSDSYHFEDEEIAYPRCLDTHESQIVFTKHLDKLLLHVLEEQATESRQGSTSCSVSPTGAPSVPELSNMGMPSKIDPLSVCASVCNSLVPTTATDSIYAADVSSFETSPSKSSSWSVSACSTGAASESCSSSFSTSSQLSYDIQTPIRFSSRYAFGSESSQDTCDVSLQGDCFSVFPVSDTVPLRTPAHQSLSPSTILAAPRKVQHHIRIPSQEADPCQSKKRPRSRSTSCSRSEGPTQDNTALQETTRSASLRERAGSLAKRRKVSVFTGGPNPGKTSLADSKVRSSGLASFRRAASIRSEVEVAGVLEEDVHMKDEESSDSPAACQPGVSTSIKVFHPSALISTRQDTPRPPISKVLHGACETVCLPTRPATPLHRGRYNDVTPSDSPLPIIAPPAYELIPRAPASREEEAERRILRLQERELEERRGDGLVLSKIPQPGKVKADNASTDEDEWMWRAVGEVETEKTRSEGTAHEHDDIGELQFELGIEEEFRADVIEWLLGVDPPSHPSKPLLCANLRAQLADSPDTRWHAAHLFTRYFLRVGVSPSSSPVAAMKKVKVSAEANDDSMDGREAVAWDFAVACLASAVKLHRDFLDPLFPVIVNEYLIIAPHVMTYDDLEAAQREVFRAFSFSFGSCTPGAYMEEIYAALPSLRSLVNTHANWDVAKAETWEILYDSLIDQNYLCYSVHLLTGCSMIFGIVESLVLKAKADHALTLHAAATGQAPLPKKSRRYRCECEKFRKKARKAVKGIEEDMRELLGLSKRSWTHCQDWLTELTENQFTCAG